MPRVKFGKESNMATGNYQIKLKADERKLLREALRKGADKSRKLTRIRILLLCDEGKSQTMICEALSITSNTVRKVCQRYQEEGLDAALNERGRSGRPNVFDGRQKAKITALACSEAPEGYGKWSLRLLSERAVELGIVDDISHTLVGRILKKTKSGRT